MSKDYERPVTSKELVDRLMRFSKTPGLTAWEKQLLTDACDKIEELEDDLTIRDYERTRD